MSTPLSPPKVAVAQPFSYDSKPLESPGLFRPTATAALSNGASNMVRSLSFSGKFREDESSPLEPEGQSPLACAA